MRQRYRTLNNILTQKLGLFNHLLPQANIFFHRRKSSFDDQICHLVSRSYTILDIKDDYQVFHLSSILNPNEIIHEDTAANDHINTIKINNMNPHFLKSNETNIVSFHTIFLKNMCEIKKELTDIAEKINRLLKR